MKSRYYSLNQQIGNVRIIIRSNKTNFRYFSLFYAIRVLTENHVHRLPIVDPISNNVIFILTHKRILRFFYLYVGIVHLKFKILYPTLFPLLYNRETVC